MDGIYRRLGMYNSNNNDNSCRWHVAEKWNKSNENYSGHSDCMIYLLCLNSIPPFTIDPDSLVLLVHYPIVYNAFFSFLFSRHNNYCRKVQTTVGRQSRANGLVHGICIVCPLLGENKICKAQKPWRICAIEHVSYICNETA